MNILVFTDAKQIRFRDKSTISGEYDKIIIDKKTAIDQKTYDFLTTRLNRKNPASEIITGYITLTGE